jgi:hypothetical protein
MIADALRAYVKSRQRSQPVLDLRIGLGYTAALLEDGNAGVAYTFREEASAGCSVFVGKRPLAGSDAFELLDYLGSVDGVESTVGLAVVNALCNRSASGQDEGDVLDLLPIGSEDQVGMVGYFGPLVEPIKKRAGRLTIFERDASRSGDVLPAAEAIDRLPGCDVAIITSTSIILGGMDDLLDASAGCREVALVGASTPLVPEVFAPRGVTLLSGVVVTDPQGILQIVSEGGGMGFFGTRIRKVNIRLQRTDPAAAGGDT